MRNHTEIGSINQHEGQILIEFTLIYSFTYNLYTKIHYIYSLTSCNLWTQCLGV